MIVKTDEELKKLKNIGRIVAQIRDELIGMVKPGVRTKYLDEVAEKRLIELDAHSAPVKDYRFPGFVCISINNVAAHGIPSSYIIKSGDIVNIDVSAEKDGYYADTGATIIAGDITEAQSPYLKFVETSKLALMNGIENARVGNRIYDIGSAISEIAFKNNYKVILNLTGHGIGRKLHESPKEISNYYCKSERDKLKNGHVLAIETFLSLNDEYVTIDDDGWGLITSESNRVAQFEHTIIVTDEGPIIIT